MSINESDSIRLVEQQLLERGWQKEDIFRSPRLYQGERSLVIDVVLASNHYLLAAVEIKTPYHRVDDAIPQILVYNKTLQAPFAIASNGIDAKIIDESGSIIPDFDELPEPDQLWAYLGIHRQEKDPRSYPSPPIEKYVFSLSQVQAVSRILDALISKTPHIIVSMPVGSGKTTVGIEVAWKVTQSKYAERLLYLFARSHLAQQVAERMSSLESVFFLDEKYNFEEQYEPGIYIGTDTFFSTLSKEKLKSFSPDHFGIIIIDDIDQLSETSFALEYFSEASRIGFSSILDQNIYHPVFTFPLQEKFDLGSRQPPPGFRAVQLSDIADIRNGQIRSTAKFARKSEKLDANAYYLVTGRAILSDGRVAVDELQTIDRLTEDLLITDATFAKDELLHPDDILLSSYFAGDLTVKVAFVPDTLPDKVIYTNRLIRIRVTDPSVNPHDVFTFLRLDTGQQALRAFANQARIAIRDISQVTVFLPEASQPEQQVSEELGTTARVIRQIRDEILPVLEDIEQHTGQLPDPAIILEPIGQQLLQIATPLAPVHIIEKAITDYPTPIALAARRFQESRFNIYEQVFRLRDLFEAASFFTYHIILADALHNLSINTYYVKNKPARTAFDDFSMKYRLDFVEAILSAAQSNNGKDLFIPELLNTSAIDIAKNLQSDFRNVLSHTATPSGIQQASIIEKFKPEVENLLKELQFLTQYRLVRIPAFYFENGQRNARLEVYKGAVPYPDEESLVVDIDHNHLGLLNQDGQFLDLHPFYQLVDVGYQIELTSEKRYETHLGFLKYIKASQLHGESVQGGFELPLNGHSDFDRLKTKLHPPI